MIFTVFSGSDILEPCTDKYYLGGKYWWKFRCRAFLIQHTVPFAKKLKKIWLFTS